jgi:hypothetical protein
LTARFARRAGAIAWLTGITPYSSTFWGGESQGLENAEESFHMPMKKKKKRAVKKTAAKSAAKKTKKRKKKK